MRSDGALLARLADLICDGGPIDWDEAEASTGSADERSWIRNLRVVCEISAAPRAAGVLPGAGSRRVPSRWGRLIVRERVGRGRFGDVFRARDPRLAREVALKIHRRGVAGRLPVDREGLCQARVRHPNIAAVFGAEIIDGLSGIWMEFIRGEAIADTISREGLLGLREASLIGIETCRALAAVHGARIVHGDVKAHNILRQTDGRIVLMDFSSSRDLREPPDGYRVSGTPLYMAPEVLQGGLPTVRSDLYSLGVLLYHLVTGSYPVPGGSIEDLRAAHRASRRVILRDLRPDLPEPYLRLVDRAIAARPEDRFRSVAPMREALSALLTARGGCRRVAPADGT